MFDPYHKWLGIAKGQRPPTHYQLLGLTQGEDDAEVIEEAAIRQTTHLRSYQIGPHAGDCTRLLNEVSEARTILLNPAKRKAYHERLTAQSAPAQQPFAWHDSPSVTKKRAAAGGRGLLIGLAACAAAVTVLLAGAIAAYFVFRGDPAAGRKDTGKVAAGTETPKATGTSGGQETKKGESSKDPLETGKGTPKEKGGTEKKSTDKEPKKKDDTKTVTDPKGKRPPLKLGKQRAWFAGEVASLVFLPDSRQLLTTGQRKVQLWDVETQQRLHLLSEDNGGSGLGRVAIDKAGKRAAVVSSDRSGADLWDLAERKKIGSIKHVKDDEIKGLALSPDGARVLTCGGHIENNRPAQTWVRVWDFESGAELFHLEGHGYFVQGVAILPDGSRAVSVAGGNDVRLWDLKEKTGIGQITVGSNQPANGFALSSDGRFLALGYYSDNTVRLIDLVERKEIAVYSGHTNTVAAVAFSADGRYVASAGWDRVVCLLDARDLTELGKVEAPTQVVHSLAFSPDGKNLAAGCNDQQIRLWPILDDNAKAKDPASP